MELHSSCCTTPSFCFAHDITFCTLLAFNDLLLILIEEERREDRTGLLLEFTTGSTRDGGSCLSWSAGIPMDLQAASKTTSSRWVSESLLEVSIRVFSSSSKCDLGPMIQLFESASRLLLTVAGIRECDVTVGGNSSLSSASTLSFPGAWRACAVGTSLEGGDAATGSGRRSRTPGPGGPGETRNIHCCYGPCLYRVDMGATRAQRRARSVCWASSLSSGLLSGQNQTVLEA
jgi:hypothetical protein